MLRAAMLGATDSLVERENDEDEPLPQFASRTPIMQRLGGRKLATEPFAEAIRLFEERRVLPRPLFDQLSNAAKQKAFTVAGLAAEELLSDAHSELARQLRESKDKTYYDEATKRWVYKGPDLRQFDKFVRERLETAGWAPANPSHVETVFRTNILSAYSSGGIVERTQPAVLVARPYWQIVGVNDSRQRKTHRDAHGTILAADNPFWRKAYPPFGYNCRCRVVSRSKRWVDAHGGPTRVPNGLPDKGFASGIDHLLPKGFQPLDVLQEGERAPAAPQPAHPIPRELPRAFPRFEIPPRPSPMPIAAHPPEFLRSPTPPQPAPDPYTISAFRSAGVRVEGDATFDAAQQHAIRVLGKPLTVPRMRELIGAEGELPGAEVSYRVSSSSTELYIHTTVEDELVVAANISRSYAVIDGEKIVHHHLFKMPTRLQGGKFGSRVFTKQIRQYLAAGIHRVETEAAWVGQYYWASIGFQLRRPSFLQVLKQEFLEYAEATGVTMANAIQVATKCASIHDLAMVKIGARKIGKEFLVNRGNSGGSLLELELDLTEGSQSRAILKQRLGI